MTYEDFKHAIEQDNSSHNTKDLALLLLAAMIDWPTTLTIENFVQELKEFYGSLLTIACIKSKPFELRKNMICGDLRQEL